MHALALEEERLQDSKERAVLDQDFKAAAGDLHRQDELNDRIVEIVRQLK